MSPTHFLLLLYKSTIAIQHHYLRSGFTNSSQLADLLNADYLKTTAKSNSHFTKQK